MATARLIELGFVFSPPVQRTNHSDKNPDSEADALFHRLPGVILSLEVFLNTRLHWVVIVHSVGRWNGVWLGESEGGIQEQDLHVA